MEESFFVDLQHGRPSLTARARSAALQLKGAWGHAQCHNVLLFHHDLYQTWLEAPRHMFPSANTLFCLLNSLLTTAASSLPSPSLAIEI